MTIGSASGSGPSCPSCGTALDLAGRQLQATQELTCPGCGGLVHARRRESAPATRPSEVQPPGAAGLAVRLAGLRALRLVYHAGLGVGGAGLLVLGGFVPVLRGWLEDEVRSGSDVFRALGAVPLAGTSSDPDADHGPALSAADAPGLFREIEGVARRLGTVSPRQVRITYLPCCCATAWQHNEALLVGLPLLHVLSRCELRAVLAHELEHLSRGDAKGAARALRFVEALGVGLEQELNPARGPLRAWAAWCRRAGEALVGPVVHGQETRADRAAATIAGGTGAASALVKVALMQSLFREVLDHYDPDSPGQPNLYAFFRAFWNHLPEPLLAAARQNLLASPGARTASGAHPALLDRIRLVQSLPDRPAADEGATTLLIADLEALEQMLHNRLFGLATVEQTIFHRAGR